MHIGTIEGWYPGTSLNYNYKLSDKKDHLNVNNAVSIIVFIMGIQDSVIVVIRVIYMVTENTKYTYLTQT